MSSKCVCSRLLGLRKRPPLPVVSLHLINVKCAADEVSFKDQSNSSLLMAYWSLC